MASGDHVAQLYAVPPSDFTSARNRLAAELRTRGRSDEARAVTELRKPSAALWAVNRLAASEPRAVTSLIEAVDRLRQSQLREPRAAAEALRAQRGALDGLVTRARQLLEGVGVAASRPMLQRISDTLLGAAADPARAAELRGARLTTELPAPGFEAFSGARGSGAPLRLVSTRGGPRAPDKADREPHPAPARTAIPGRRGGSTGTGREPDAGTAATAARQDRAAQAEAERRRRAQEAAELERRVTEHERIVTQLEAEIGAARARVAELEGRLRAARQAAAAARRVRRPPGR